MMSRKMDALDQASMAALVGAAVIFFNKASAAVDRFMAKRNGGTVYDNVKKAQAQVDDIDKRLTVVESKIEDVRDSLKDMKSDVQRYHKELMQTREEFRVSFGSIEGWIKGKSDN
jgi:peptidoglycan hydrolase CwlO-like protein